MICTLVRTLVLLGYSGGRRSERGEVLATSPHPGTA